MTAEQRRGRNVLVGILIWVVAAEIVSCSMFWASGEPVTNEQLLGEAVKFVVSVAVMIAAIKGNKASSQVATGIMLVRGLLFGLAAWEQLQMNAAPEGGHMQIGPEAVVFLVLAVGYLRAVRLLMAPNVTEYIASRDLEQPKGT